MSLILVAVLVLVVIGMAYGLYTRQGSGIDHHPTGDSGDPVPGDETKTSAGPGDEDEVVPGVDPTEGHEQDQRGTR